MYKKWIWHLITYNGLCAMKPNQTKLIRHSHNPAYESDWLARIVVNHSLNLTNKFFSGQNHQNGIWELPYLCNHYGTHRTHFESSVLNSDWQPNTVKFFLLKLLPWMPTVQKADFKFLEDWIASLLCFSCMQYPTDFSLVHNAKLII